MTYRDDLDALAARHAALAADVARKQRELDEVAAMLDEARRVDQAESHFARTPARKRRQQRSLLIGALAAVLVSGLGLGYLSEAAAEARTATGMQVTELAGRVSLAFERADRRQAAYEALRHIGLTKKEDREARKRAWKAGEPLAFGAYFVTEELRSLAREDQR